MNIKLLSTIIAVIAVSLSFGGLTVVAAAGDSNLPVTLEGDPQTEPVEWITLDGSPAILRCTNVQHVLGATIWNEKIQELEYQEVSNPELCPGYKGPATIIFFEDDPLDARVHPVRVLMDNGNVAVVRCTSDLRLLSVYWNDAESSFDWEEKPSMMCMT